MKNICVLFLCLLLLFPAISLADEQITVLEVTGFGLSRNEAIRDGLVQALKQNKGVTIDSQKSFAKLLRDKSISNNGSNSHEVEIQALSEVVVKELTQGLINEYRIIDSKSISSNEWEVSLEVKMLQYLTPGISPHSRRKIAVIPFRVTKSIFSDQGSNVSSLEISRQFTQKLVTELTQARKFSVIDREHMEEFLQEKKLLLSDDASFDEQMKIGAALGVDYLLLGTISDLDQKKTRYKIQATGETGNNHSATFVADYRIIVMATRQVKWSDSVTLSLDNDEIERIAPNLSSGQILQALLERGAQNIIHKAMGNIYPLKVVKVQPNGDIVINQGGITVSRGDILDVYATGEKIIDPYTGESLGSSETWIAQIELTRIVSKLSYAKVLTGGSTKVDIGNICRRADAEKASLPAPARMKSDVTSSSNGGVILPFD